MLDGDNDDRRVLILFASETGTSEDVAFRIGRYLRRWHWRPRILSIGESSLDDLFDENLLITVCSTTGNGVEPRSMTSFWNSLMRADLPPSLLDHLDLASLSIGDSSYERFCWAGKKLHRRLVTLGAHDVLPRTDADEQHYLGIDGTVIEWLESLRTALDILYPCNLSPLPDQTLAYPRVTLTPGDGASSSRTPSPRRYHPEAPHTAKLKSFVRLTREDWYQDVRHIELELSENVPYEPGDIALLYPSNQPSDVEMLIKHQSWQERADDLFDLSSSDPNSLPRGLPETATLRDLLTRYLDIRAVPKLSFFDFCRHFAADEREREKLEEFTTSQGQDDLYAYSTRPRRTSLEVLADFPSIRIPFSFLFDVFGTMRPRQFSIASYSAAHPGKIELCVAMVRYKSLVLRKERVGMCSNWLMNLPIGSELALSIETSTLGQRWRTLRDEKKPMICIGPGTGIAPMRAVLEQRIMDGVDDNVLFFGCRSAAADFHYRSELEGAEHAGHLRLFAAASRDQENKIYVQDLIQEQKNFAYDLVVERNGAVLISGSSGKMPTAVRRAFIDVLMQVSQGRSESWDEERAERYIADMELNGRWLEETW